MHEKKGNWRVVYGLRVVGGAVEEREAGDRVGGRVLENVEILARLRFGIARPHSAEKPSDLKMIFQFLNIASQQYLILVNNIHKFTSKCHWGW